MNEVVIFGECKMNLFLSTDIEWPPGTPQFVIEQFLANACAADQALRDSLSRAATNAEAEQAIREHADSIEAAFAPGRTGLALRVQCYAGKTELSRTIEFPILVGRSISKSVTTSMIVPASLVLSQNGETFVPLWLIAKELDQQSVKAEKNSGKYLRRRPAERPLWPDKANFIAAHTAQLPSCDVTS